MMNENSPICARLMPACIEVRVPLPGEERAERDAHDLAADHDHRESTTIAQPVPAQQRGIDRHARPRRRRSPRTCRAPARQVARPPRAPRLGDQRAREEGAERDRVAHLLREQRRDEADADARDQAWSRARPSRDDSRGWSAARPACRPRAGSPGTPPARPASRASAPGRQAGARRDRGERRHQHHRDQVLDDQDADHQLAQPAADPLLVEHLGDDRGARDRDDRAVNMASSGVQPNGARRDDSRAARHRHVWTMCRDRPRSARRARACPG